MGAAQASPCYTCGADFRRQASASGCFLHCSTEYVVEWLRARSSPPTVPMPKPTSATVSAVRLSSSCCAMHEGSRSQKTEFPTRGTAARASTAVVPPTASRPPPKYRGAALPGFTRRVRSPSRGRNWNGSLGKRPSPRKANSSRSWNCSAAPHGALQIKALSVSRRSSTRSSLVRRCTRKVHDGSSEPEGNAAAGTCRGVAARVSSGAGGGGSSARAAAATARRPQMSRFDPSFRTQPPCL